MQRLIDVSEHNGDVNWEQAARRVAGAIVRIADGDHRDTFYGTQRVKEIRAAGLIWGPYYYARVASAGNGQRNGAREAKMAIEFARAGGWPDARDLPLAYDFEDLNGQTTTKAAKHLGQFVRAYQAAMGHLPLLYTMPGFWPAIERNLSPADREFVRRCPLWIAHWEVARPTVPLPWRSWSVWQDTDRATCPGVSGPVDHNRVSPQTKLAELTIEAQAGPKPVTPPTQPAGGVAPAAPEKPRPAAVPAWLPEKHWQRWQTPWSASARNNDEFKDLLWKHGLVSPNFSVDETRCHDPARTAVPKLLKGNVQRHAFNLEIFRHEMGDKPLAIVSWYRTPAWNAHVGGASQSRHMQADATDFEVGMVESFGHERWDRVADRVFAQGGVGSYPAGSRHLDSRGTRARWTSH
jgi:GH25 family lysozyme M1 (1,4-beta-N-acetylmuramidase)